MGVCVDETGNDHGIAEIGCRLSGGCCGSDLDDAIVFDRDNPVFERWPGDRGDPSSSKTNALHESLSAVPVGDRRHPCVPVCLQLIFVRDAQEFILGEVRAHQLHADRQIRGGKARRDADGWDTRQIG